MSDQNDPDLAPAPEPAPQPKAVPWALRPRTMVTGAVVLALASLPLSWLTYPASGDVTLPASEQLARELRFQQGAALSLPLVQPHERVAALQAMKLPADQQAALEQELRDQRSELVWFTLWDDRDQDGDVVAIASDGFRQTVTIAHALQRLAVLRPKSGAITVTGVHDGGGGITVALATDTGKVPLPVMAVGQSLAVPVR